MGGKYSAEWWEKIAGLSRDIPRRILSASLIISLGQLRILRAHRQRSGQASRKRMATRQRSASVRQQTEYGCVARPGGRVFARHIIKP